MVRRDRPLLPDSDEPDLLGDVRRMLGKGHPWELLCFASTLLTTVDPRCADPFARARGEAPDGPTREELVGSFLEVGCVETTALLTVLAELVPDELLARRACRELAGRDDQLPGWLEGLAPVAVDRAVEMSHPLGDGDNIMIGLRTGVGHALTTVVYVDHNLGTIVKDAFVVGEPLEAVVDDFRDASGADPDIVYADVDLAEARARVTAAVETAARTYPPLETDSWPACRPLVEWVARQLPDGGVGYVRPEWDDAARAALAERFFASAHARGYEDEDRDLLPALLWFACDYGAGDPLRWSPVAVELLLADWLPRKVVADTAFLARAPALLRGLVRFSHAERGIRAGLTEETLAAVDRWEPTFLEAIRAPRTEASAALREAMGAADESCADGWLGGLGGVFGDLFGDAQLTGFRQRWLSILRDAVGGDEALWHLDAEPLPDEAFDWPAVPDDVGEPVGEALVLVDGCCEELLDAEWRTACRRLLADVAAGDPAIFRRGSRADTAAAAVVWTVGKANDLFSARTGGLTAKEALAWFGVSASVSQRAATMQRALGVEAQPAHDVTLQSPRYLVASKRAAIMRDRDAAAAASE